MILKKILANIFTDGVILQRDMPIRIWGNIVPDKKVSVRFDNDAYEITAKSDGSWEVYLPELPAGGPHKLVVQSGDVVQEINDILMGDIWICSGQSNMELPMSRTKRMFDKYNQTACNPNIRQYHVPMNYNFHERQDEIPESKWIAVTPGQTEKFTAVGFFFANKVYETVGVPIGLILVALGGTPVESWMSRSALIDCGADAELARAKQCAKEGYIEGVTAKEEKIHRTWYQQLNQFDRGIVEKWYEEAFDDFDWKELALDTPWDQVTDLKASGSVWFRKEIYIPKELAGKRAYIMLGCIVDADEVYVNGEKIGEIAYRYPPRDYLVPNLKEGRNSIAIRVIAANGSGEFVFDKVHQLIFEDEKKTAISLHDTWKYKRALSCPPLLGGSFFQNTPTGNYNGMIAPLHKIAIKGVIWYQGESNAGNPDGYSKRFGKMITDWRENWEQGDFPFIFAQLANWSPKGELMHWEVLRDEQTKTLAIPNTRMAVTNDIGEHNDLHPLNKKAVGERLAGEALSLAYDRQIVSTGPTLTKVEKSENQLLLHFETKGSLLTLKYGSVVYGLSVWIHDIEIPVEGTVEGKTVIIHTSHVNKVTAVSYAWIDDPADANLYNVSGLPTIQFKKEV